MTLGNACHGGEPWGVRLKAWREDQKKWTSDDLREEVEATSYKLREARGSRLHCRLIARWESGEVKSPQRFYLRILAEMGAPLPDSRDDALNRSMQSENREEDMDRRNFLLGAGAVVAAAALTPGSSYGGRRVPQAVGMGDVRAIRRAVDELYSKDQLVGGASLAELALAQYLDARQMLDEADYAEDISRELMTISGELAVCVGWLSYDAGNQPQSRNLYMEGFMLADQAGDARLAIQATEKLALQAVYVAEFGNHRGAAREATRLGDRLDELARRQDSARLHALVAARQAIARAMSGEKSDFRRAITRSWRELDRAGAVATDERWLQFVTRGEIMVHEAKGYRYLGDPVRAVRLYEEGLEDDGLSPRNRANYQAQLAATMISVVIRLAQLAKETWP